MPSARIYRQKKAAGVSGGLKEENLLAGY